MCGRYTLRTPLRRVSELLNLSLPFDLPPRYNIAPTQMAPLARIAEDGQREAVLASWGLIPSWARDPGIASTLINCRSETAASKPAFRAAMRQRRCLIPADGFYEWQRVGRRKQPYLIEVGAAEPYAYAGLWERWQSPTGPFDTFTILTTSANQRLAPLHERMPVILDPIHFDEWLDHRRAPDRVQHLLAPYPDEAFRLTPVGTAVNSARHDAPDCVAPLAAEELPEPPLQQKSLLD